MFSKVLIANRGEIAVRIIAACRELGVQTVAVHSEADRECLHVKLADEAVCIGPSDSASSYLNTTSVMSAAQITGADAIHPGYGFLAENAHFAEIVDEVRSDLYRTVPRGDPPDGQQVAGARTTMAAAEVPVLPGSDGRCNRRPRRSNSPGRSAFRSFSKRRPAAAGAACAWPGMPKSSSTPTTRPGTRPNGHSGDPTLYLEKYLQRPRHIEFQILADSHGRVIHLGERECSIQRRHQKIIEEAPSVALDPDLRAEMGRAAVAAARAAKYENAGTVEFLLDEDGSFYFMEMNTRIQVEHPVTELVTGVDLVIEQLRIAAGKPISVAKRKQVRPKGHAIEFRINAEDPATFAPSPGRITHFSLPSGPGIRLDTHIYGGYAVPPYYDSLVAKLLVYGKDREEAIARGTPRPLHAQDRGHQDLCFPPRAHPRIGRLQSGSSRHSLHGTIPRGLTWNISVFPARLHRGILCVGGPGDKIESDGQYFPRGVYGCRQDLGGATAGEAHGRAFSRSRSRARVERSVVRFPRSLRDRARPPSALPKRICCGNCRPNPDWWWRPGAVRSRRMAIGGSSKKAGASQSSSTCPGIICNDASNATTPIDPCITMPNRPVGSSKSVCPTTAVRPCRSPSPEMNRRKTWSRPSPTPYGGCRAVLDPE